MMWVRFGKWFGGASGYGLGVLWDMVRGWFGKWFGGWFGDWFGGGSGSGLGGFGQWFGGGSGSVLGVVPQEPVHGLPRASYIPRHTYLLVLRVPVPMHEQTVNAFQFPKFF